MEIARITRTLIDCDPNAINIIIQSKSARGATELMIYMHDRDYLFPQFTHILDKLQLNIVEAKIYSGSNTTTLVVIHLLNNDNEIITDQATLERISDTLKDRLSQSDENEMVHAAESRRMRVFDTPTEIEFEQLNDEFTEVSINTKDIPGLLARIGQAFKERKSVYTMPKSIRSEKKQKMCL